MSQTGLVLCLDTSTDAAVALCRDPNRAAGFDILAHERSGNDRRHTETLTAMIDRALRAAGITPGELSAVVAGTGPAPFTGLRVGLATARALAYAQGIPALGVCSLEALALAAGDGEVLTVSDAKRREVHYARYRVADDEVHTVAPPAVGRPTDVAEEHHDLVASGAVYGPALGPYAEVFAPGVSDLGHRAAPVDPAHLTRIALHHNFDPAALPLHPQYLRRPDVHLPSGRKRATGR